MEIDVQTKRGTEAEQVTAKVLRQQLAKYDVAAWAFTKRVVIDERATPHSHPVLTLSPRLLFREEVGLLSMYMHEQIHWHLIALPREVQAARKDLRALFPSVPNRRGGGDRTKRSTYLHLLVNWLEVESLRRVTDDATSERMLAVTADGPVYGWIYRQVRDRHADLARVVTRHDLLGPLAPVEGQGP